MSSKKLFALLLVLVMTFALAACAQPAAPATDSPAAATKAPAAESKDDTADAAATDDAAADAAIDTSASVSLLCYLMGDPQPDHPAVNKMINDILTEKINATVEISYIPWADFATKYQLLLTSGETIDMIYSANWLTDRDYSKRNAFHFLEDVIPNVAPELMDHIGEEYWADATENGHIYTIPCTWREFIDTGVQYREDLRVKYDLPVPDTIDNLYDYLVGIKENETGMQPTVEGGETGAHLTGFSGIDLMQLEYMYFLAGDTGLMVGYSEDGNFSYRDVLDYYGSERHIKDMQTMKRFLDAGLWSRNALSQKVDDRLEALKNGQCAAVISGQNPNKWGGAVGHAELNNPDWEFKYVTYKGLFGYATPVQPTQNGTAFPVSGKNLERAIMATSLLTLDKELHDLGHFGIEGTHYTRNGDIYIADPTNSNNFAFDGMDAWNWRNEDHWIAEESYNLIKDANVGYSALKQLLPLSFAADNSTVETEKAALAQVRNQYLAPISIGLSNDIEKDVADFMQKANAAGLEKIQKTYKEQWLAFCDLRGLE